MDSSIVSSNRSNLHYTGLLLGCLIFMRTMPCYLWALEDILRPICAILVLIISLLNLSKEKWTIWIFLSISLAYIWATVFVDHSGVITVFNFIAFAFLTIIKKELIFEAYSTFRTILSFFLFLSLINYFFFLLGVDFLSVEIAPLNSLREHTYMMHPFLVVPNGMVSSRFFAIYDEPGMIGNIAGMILIAERMDFKSTKNKIILMCGLLSFSLYFYVSLVIGLIFFSQKIKNKWVPLILMLAFVVLTYNNDFFYDTIWHRFEFDSTEGKFVGDNRNDKAVDNAFESIQGTVLLYTGMGAYMTEEFSGSASLKLIILKHGLIFVILNLIGYFLLSIRQIKNRVDLTMYFIFFLLTLYQRPGFYNTSSVFLYVMVIYVFGSNATKHLERNNVPENR